MEQEESPGAKLERTDGEGAILTTEVSGKGMQEIPLSEETMAMFDAATTNANAIRSERGPGGASNWMKNAIPYMLPDSQAERDATITALEDVYEGTIPYIQKDQLQAEDTPSESAAYTLDDSGPTTIGRERARLLNNAPGINEFSSSRDVENANVISERDDQLEALADEHGDDARISFTDPEEQEQAISAKDIRYPGEPEAPETPEASENLPEGEPEAAKRVGGWKEQQGKPEKNVGKFLEDAGLSEAVMADEDFYLKVENEPFIPLNIERHDDQLMLYHTQVENGDAYIDSEMVFNLDEDGGLELAETAVHVPRGESRGLDRTFGGIFAKNLRDQGFAEAAAKAMQSEPEAEAEVSITDERGEPQEEAPQIRIDLTPQQQAFLENLETLAEKVEQVKGLADEGNVMPFTVDVDLNKRGLETSLADQADGRQQFDLFAPDEIRFADGEVQVQVGIDTSGDTLEEFWVNVPDADSQLDNAISNPQSLSSSVEQQRPDAEAIEPELEVSEQGESKSVEDLLEERPELFTAQSNSIIEDLSDAPEILYQDGERDFIETDGQLYSFQTDEVNEALSEEVETESVAPSDPEISASVEEAQVAESQPALEEENPDLAELNEGEAPEESQPEAVSDEDSPRTEPASDYRQTLDRLRETIRELPEEQQGALLSAIQSTERQIESPEPEPEETVSSGELVANTISQNDPELDEQLAEPSEQDQSPTVEEFRDWYRAARSLGRSDKDLKQIETLGKAAKAGELEDFDAEVAEQMDADLEQFSQQEAIGQSIISNARRFISSVEEAGLAERDEDGAIQAKGNIYTVRETPDGIGVIRNDQSSGVIADSDNNITQVTNLTEEDQKNWQKNGAKSPDDLRSESRLKESFAQLSSSSRQHSGMGL